MKWAIQKNERITAYPQAKAKCPACSGDVIAKCGDIMQWHWAHKAADCDPWSEPESQWHRSWKQKFPDEWQEVVVGNHRADVKTPIKVLEIQASSISAGEIRAREIHYGNMAWLLKGDDFLDNMELRRKGNIYTFRWKHPRKSWWNAKRQIFIDHPYGIFKIGKIHPQVPCGGWGKMITDDQFLDICGASYQKRIGLDHLI